jgi:hypothetical protein
LEETDEMLITRPGENRDFVSFTQDALLAVSRLLRYEALYLFFNSCKFRVLYLPDLIPFLDFIGPYCCSAIRYLTISDTFFPTMWHSEVILQNIRWLNALPQLKRLTLNLCIEDMISLRFMRHSVSIYHIPHFKTYMELPSMNALLQLRGSMKVKLMFDYEPTLNAWSSEIARSLKLGPWPARMLQDLGDFFRCLEKAIDDALVKPLDSELTHEKMYYAGSPQHRDFSEEGDIESVDGLPSVIEDSSFGEGSEVEVDYDKDDDELPKLAASSEEPRDVESD